MRDGRSAAAARCDAIARWGTVAVAAIACSVGGCEARECAPDFGEVVDMHECATVELPGVTVRYLGSERTGNLPMSCANYTASAGGATTSFRQCSTGVLGGSARFDVDGRSYTALFDVPAGCGRAPSGAWTPAPLGIEFLEGALEGEGLSEAMRRNARLVAECFARNTKNDD